MQRPLDLLNTVAVGQQHDERFDRIVRLATRILKVSSAAISVADGNRHWFLASRGLTPEVTPRDITFCVHSMLSPELLVVTDAMLDPQFANDLLVVGAQAIRFYAGFPLCLADGKRIGTLGVFDPKPQQLSEDQLKGLKDLAEIATRELAKQQIEQLVVKLTENEQRLQNFLDTASDLIQITDTQGRYLMANQAWLQLFGVQREQLHELTITDVIAPHYRAQWQQYVSRVIQGERLSEIELVFCTKSGEQVRLVGSLNCELQNQKPVAVRAIFRNGSSIAAVEEKFRRVVMMAPVAVVLVNTEGTITLSNGVAEQLFGYGHQELIGESIEKLVPDTFRVMVEDIGQFMGDVFFSSTLGMIRRIDVGMRKDGTQLPINFGMTLLETENYLEFLATMTDLTEQKRVEQMLREAKENAENASRAKSDFLTNMSHELRTPLNAILGFAQVILLSSQLPKPVTENVREIERAGKHLLALVNGLIDLAKIEEGKLLLDKRPVKVVTVLEETFSLMNLLATEGGIALQPRIEIPVDTTIVADFVRFRQVIINLLSNAIKYNKPGGWVALVCTKKNSRVRIEVNDNGIGIAQHKQSQIFKVFERLGAEHSNIPGAGIGLLITKRLVEEMGGTIGFSSTEGVGSSFWIEFPVHVVEATNELEAGETAANHELTVSREAPRSAIVYVEDNPTNVRLMQQIFATRPNWQLYDVPNAEEGLQLINTKEPALVLMDINLPGMSGFEALQVLKNSEKTKHIPVIAVSSNAMKGDIEHGLNAGFSAYVTKPIEVAVLLSTVERFMTVTNSSAVNTKQTLRVLAVDDHPANQELLRAQFALLGYQADIAGDGEDALALWNTHHHAIVVTDFHMPKMNGLVLASKIREAEELFKLQTTIIGLTGIDDAEIHQCIDAGMDEVLRKPVELKDLRKCLNAWSKYHQ